jgi:hypothetical protein
MQELTARAGGRGGHEHAEDDCCVAFTHAREKRTLHLLPHLRDVVQQTHSGCGCRHDAVQFGEEMSGTLSDAPVDVEAGDRGDEAGRLGDLRAQPAAGAAYGVPAA